ncbi:metalloregulator ArsR/SmtB family transcription factor [Pelagibacterium sediminicola]|uniref:metalloregulator ArsR/SmtB family transcription factor n=1 Tax=Pelagibacterium sediminicola TaxID=2248761 RepID=UPI000E31E1D2|nr:metalloregulator ArsR/SmtB family transcription factor [Pelagibacterium sediminicola]
MLKARPTQNAEKIVTLLKAAGETTRLRLLALLAEGELSVKDFTEILGQSQPRISRHLKLLVDAQLVTRHAEGAWAYFRLADRGAGRALNDWLFEIVDLATPELRRDREKLAAVREAHREQANAYFAKIAGDWDKLRSLHAPDSAVEAAIVEMAGGGEGRLMLDLGTGTGRMLELLADRYEYAIGIDSSREMLAIARAKVDAAGLGNVQVRLRDITDIGDHAGSADLVIIHQVLHYFDDPAAALIPAAESLAPGGVLLVVDFAPHNLEFLRTEQAHRRLGLSDEQMNVWARAAGLEVEKVHRFPSGHDGGLTVCLWRLERRA